MFKKIVSAVMFFLASISLAFAAINLNTATEQELDSLPGIGPAKAKAIVEYRKANGNFKSIDDLKNVKGIGDKTFDDLKGSIAVSGANAPVAAPPKSDKPAAPIAAPKSAEKPVDKTPIKPAAKEEKAAAKPLAPTEAAKPAVDDKAAKKAAKDAEKAAKKAEREAKKAAKAEAKAAKKADKEAKDAPKK